MTVAPAPVVTPPAPVAEDHLDTLQDNVVDFETFSERHLAQCFEAPSAKYSRETFKRTYGPSYYAFEYGGVLFLMLDNINYLGFDPTKSRGGRQV